jgi:hypothetical protein
MLSLQLQRPGSRQWRSGASRPFAASDRNTAAWRDVDRGQLELNEPVFRTEADRRNINLWV